LVPPGAYGCDTRHIFPNGEHAHGAYSVSTCDTAAFVAAPFPLSTRTVRPNPSSVVRFHRVAVPVVSVAVCWFAPAPPETYV
jgi:acyl-coenzyme A thioesterase PaaI-like protein